MNLIRFPDEKIRRKSLEVKFPLSDEDKETINEMIHYIDESQEAGSTLRQGIGIAAVQLGHLKRMFYINVQYNEDKVFRDVIINPMIKAKFSTPAALANGEGCLSIDESEPGQGGLVHRKNHVVFRGYSYFEKKERE